MKILLAIFISIALASCGTLSKSVHKQTTDSTSNVSTRDKSVSIISEKIDTSVKLKGDTAKASKPLENILKGDTLKASTNGTSLEVFYNPTTGQVHAKAITEPKDVPVIMDRTTRIENDIEQDEEYKFHNAIEDKEVEREESNLLNPWLYVVWLILALALAYLIYRIKTKIF
jgi:hypothetical protein